MVYDETGYFLVTALRQSLRAAEALPEKLPEKSRSSLQSKLKAFSFAIIDHMSGNDHKPQPLAYFGKQAAKIERRADQLSDKFFTPIQIRLNPIFDEARRITQKPRKQDAYGYSLRESYTRQRISLIQQVAGARLYPNNADLGGEFECCIKEYLEKNLGSDVRVTLGGHICDHEGNRSDQMDIIVSIADGVPFQPSSRVDGKSICLIEHVVAAITVKTKITRRNFKDAWKNIQSIPVYHSQDEDRPRLKGHSWPLCFAVCETTEGLDSVEDQWTDTVRNDAKHTHDFQLLFSLTEGFLYPNTVCWPLIAFGLRSEYSVTKIEDFRASIGLGWMLLSIIARGALLAGKEPEHFKKISKTLHRLSLKEGVSPTYDPRHDLYFWADIEIHGKLKTGTTGKRISNSRFATSLKFEEQTYYDLSRPNPNYEKERKERIFGTKPYELRFFLQYAWQIQNNRVLLQEWQANEDGTYTVKPAAFCSSTGHEVKVPHTTYSEANKNIESMCDWPFLETDL